MLPVSQVKIRDKNLKFFLSSAFHQTELTFSRNLFENVHQPVADNLSIVFSSTQDAEAKRQKLFFLYLFLNICHV